MTAPYTCQPVCGPARSAIFTGLWPHSNGQWANNLALGDNITTIGQRLRDQGIHCGYIGKWHLDATDYFGTGRCPDGWDARYWYDHRCYLEGLSPAERRQSRKVETNASPGVAPEFTYGYRCSDRAVDFLTRHEAEDFFLVVSYDEPHHPFLCPPPFVSMYKDYAFPKSRNIWDNLADKPEHQRVWSREFPRPDPDTLTLRMPDILGCNSFVDQQIGRVLAAINRYAPEALVIYTSDHGDAFLSHGITSKGPAMYDELTRIPLLIRWPGHTSPGSVNADPASHIDLAPTILDAFGLPLPRLLPGASMLPRLRSPAARTTEPVFMEFGRYELVHDGHGAFQPIRAVFDGRYKLVINLLTSDELYDLHVDPEEMTNLIDSPGHVPQRNQLHDRLLRWMDETGDPFRGYYWARRPWRSDARPATWAWTNMTRQRENEEYEPRQMDYTTGLPMLEASWSWDNH